MKIIEFEDEKQWLEYRRLGIGASDIPAICGVCPYRTSLQTYISKVFGEEQEDNFWMARGRANEGEARLMFELTRGGEYPPTFCVHEHVPYFFASLDGYNKKDNTILEIKNPGSKVLAMAARGDVPINYMYQIQWQLMISNANRAYYFVYNAETMEQHIIEVYPDLELQKKITKAAHDFWEMVQNQTPPKDKRDTRLVDDETSAIMSRMYDLKQEIKNLSCQYESLKSQLIDMEGEGMSLESERFLFYKSERASIDYKRAAEDFKADLTKYTKPVSITWTIKEKKGESS